MPLKEPEEAIRGANKYDITSIRNIWNIETVPEITISLFFLKFVRYGTLKITSYKHFM